MINRQLPFGFTCHSFSCCKNGGGFGMGDLERAKMQSRVFDSGTFFFCVCVCDLPKCADGQGRRKKKGVCLWRVWQFAGMHEQAGKVFDSGEKRTQQATLSEAKLALTLCEKCHRLHLFALMMFAWVIVSGCPGTPA